MLLYGTDPEFFSVMNNVVISPALLELDYGIKTVIDDEKHPVYILNKGKNYSWMMDGVAWELTILKPLQTPEEMYDIVNYALYDLNRFLFKVDRNLQLYTKPVVNIDTKMYLPRLDIERIYQGFIFGCDKDDDAILTDYVCTTQNVETHPFRYAGGHFHMSGCPLFEYYIPAIKLMAICIGNFCNANSHYPELEKQRATTYGKPGRYRRQIYKDGTKGLEYRTPSNSWLSFPLSGYRGMFKMAEKAVNYLETERTDIIKKYLDDTVLAITTADQNLSRKILEELN